MQAPAKRHVVFRCVVLAGLDVVLGRQFAAVEHAGHCNGYVTTTNMPFSTSLECGPAFLAVFGMLQAGSDGWL